MSFEIIVLAVLAFIAPYCMMLRLRASFSLNIRAEGRSRLVRMLCTTLLKPLVLLSGSLLAAAVIFHRTGRSDLGGVAFASGLLFVLILMIPGFAAFQQEYPSIFRKRR